MTAENTLPEPTLPTGDSQAQSVAAPASVPAQETHVVD